MTDSSDYTAQYVAILDHLIPLLEKVNLHGINPELFSKVSTLPRKIPPVSTPEEIPKYLEFCNQITSLLGSGLRTLHPDVLSLLLDLETLLADMGTSYRIILEHMVAGADTDKPHRGYFNIDKYGEFSILYIRKILERNRTDTNQMVYAELEGIKSSMFDTASQPTTSQPTTSQPTTSQPTTSQPTTTYNLSIVQKWADFRSMCADYFGTAVSARTTKIAPLTVLRAQAKKFNTDIVFSYSASGVFYNTDVLVAPPVPPKAWGLNPDILDGFQTIRTYSTTEGERFIDVIPGETYHITGPEGADTVLFIRVYNNNVCAMLGLNGSVLMPRSYFISLLQPSKKIAGYNALLSTAILERLEKPLVLAETREESADNYQKLTHKLITAIDNGLTTAIGTITQTTTPASINDAIRDTVARVFYTLFGDNSPPEIQLTLFYSLENAMNSLIDNLLGKLEEAGVKPSQHSEPDRYIRGKISEVVQQSVREIMRKNDNIFNVVAVKKQLVNCY